MAFEIDDNLVLRIRKGNTGEVYIDDLPAIFLGYTMRFMIKKDPYVPDSSAFVNITTTVVREECSCENEDCPGYKIKGLIKITAEDSDKLPVKKDEEYSSYVWGVLVEDGTGENAHTIIPAVFEEMPECRVYPEIAGNN